MSAVRSQLLAVSSMLSAAWASTLTERLAGWLHMVRTARWHCGAEKVWDVEKPVGRLLPPLLQEAGNQEVGGGRHLAVAAI